MRSFGTCTADLIALADWLSQCGVQTIAMESTVDLVRAFLAETGW